MAILSANSRAWLKAIFGAERLKYIESEAANLSQKEAEQLVEALKDMVNEEHRKSGAAANTHPGLSYWGTAYKSQRPTPTLADLQAKQKTLSARIRQTVSAAKDATESAEANATLELMELADDLELSQDGVIELVRQYSMAEVTSILRTLSGQKSAGKAFKSAFFGIETDRADIADVNTSLQQARKSNRFWR